MLKNSLFFLVSIFLSADALAKTVINVNKSSSACSVAFETGAVKRIGGEKYLGLNIPDIKLGDLHMVKGSLESSVSSEWLNTGEKYFISAYINYSMGPKHIPITIPQKSEDNNRYVDINIDKYLPCSCFTGAEKPDRCVEKNCYIIFRDQSGDWWRQVDEMTAKRIEE